MMAAAATAVAVHAALIGWLAWQEREQPALRAPSLMPGLSPAEMVSAIMLIDDREMAPGPVIAVAGAESKTRDGSQPPPRGPSEVPGDRAAARGGGPGGPDSFTGRVDRESFQAQIWNDPERNRLPRQRSASRAASPEALIRTPLRGFDDRTATRPRARHGSETPAPGGSHAPQPGGPAALAARPRWEDRDPIFDGVMGSRAAQRTSGTPGPRGRMLAELGSQATETARRGPGADTLDTAAAASEPTPIPIELTRPGAGEREQGHGIRGPGQPAGLGSSSSGGSAQLRADVGSGEGELTVHAGRHDPYFRRMYQRLDELVRFPHELALALEQGEVVVRFTLLPGGELGELEVTRSSGFAAFDRELLRAIRRAAPFGRVPRALLRGKKSLLVLAPYTFANPLIRQ